MIDFISDMEIYRRIFLEEVPKTKSFLWLATADIKDVHIQDGKKFKPFLGILAEMLEKDIDIRLIHAKEPGPIFREEFDRFPILGKRLERLLCQRVHFKSIIIDGEFAYTGSANLTGAGMGCRNEHKRNFESGIISDEKHLVDKIMEQFDMVWMGTYCPQCRYKNFCPDKDQMIHDEMVQS